MKTLNLNELRQANIERNKIWDPDSKIGPSFRGLELAGEVGEACNVIKKLEREALGIVGSRDTVDHLAEELADALICVDLIAMVYNIDLSAATVKKFNASSDEHNFDVRINLT